MNSGIPTKLHQSLLDIAKILKIDFDCKMQEMKYLGLKEI